MEDASTYQMFKLLNQEFTFDVDVSAVPCGVNGALYFVNMDPDGGKERYDANNAGAEYGVGYCDAQCARDLKFINGLGNVEGWEPSEDPNAGVGNHGACCPEMDIWEANSISNAVTPHTCDQSKQTMCTAPSCGGTYGEERYAGPCDPDGCDFNPFRMGNESFYGPGKIVDTNSKLTVVTQFITDDGTSSGTLSEIRRFYAQNGKVIPQSESTIQGVPGNAINEEFCPAQKEVFGDQNTWKQHGGFPAMSEALSQGMVLVMSLWDDYYAHMLWLDSDYPVDADPSEPGVSRGTCPTDSGVPSEVESNYPDSHVIFSNIKVGPHGSTFGSDGSDGSDSPGGSSTTSSSAGGPTGGSGTAGQWEQCGGQGWSGPTTCASPYTCVEVNDYYSQCQ